MTILKIAGKIVVAWHSVGSMTPEGVRRDGAHLATQYCRTNDGVLQNYRYCGERRVQWTEKRMWPLYTHFYVASRAQVAIRVTSKADYLL